MQGTDRELPGEKPRKTLGRQPVPELEFFLEEMMMNSAFLSLIVLFIRKL